MNNTGLHWRDVVAFNGALKQDVWVVKDTSLILEI